MPVAKTRIADAAEREAVIELMTNVSPPLNIRLVEWVSRVMRLHWLAASLLLALIASSPTLIWAAVGLNGGPGQPVDYLLGYVVMLAISFTSLLATRQYYTIGLSNLPVVIRLLEPDDLAEQVVDWLARFRLRSQSIMLVGVAALSMTLAALPTADQVGALTMLTGLAALSGLLPGVLSGSNLHFYINFLAITPAVLSGRLRLNSLFPAETIGLRVLFGVAQHFARVFLIVASIQMASVMLFLATSGSYRLEGHVLTAGIMLVSIWGLAAITIRQTLGPIGRVIREQKNRVLGEFQHMIEAKHRELQSGQPAQTTVGDIEKLLALYSSVKKSASLPIDLDTITRFAVTFLIPLLPLLADLLVK